MLRIFPIIGLIGLASACAQPAYVHQESEFNRASPDFGKDPIDIQNVTVCYSSRGSTPSEVLGLARAECAKFGKTVEFTKQDYSICPLQTPVSAHFSCLGDAQNRPLGSGTLSSSDDGRHTINYDGILFSY